MMRSLGNYSLLYLKLFLKIVKKNRYFCDVLIVYHWAMGYITSKNSRIKKIEFYDKRDNP
jgi:hypothetical protein